MRATKEAFRTVPETCPHVDKALDAAADLIKHQTGALRDALIEALERAMAAEELVDELEAKIKELRLELEDERNRT